MGLFKQIAEPLVSRGVPVIPLRPKTKIAFLNNWQEVATTDPGKIQEWDEQYSDANGACVAFAKPDGIWFFEIDKQGFVQTIEEQTGQKLPETFMVRSSPGRGHFYFKQTPASIAMGNQQGRDDTGKETWSARVDNRYVVAPGSIHPISGLQYQILRDTDIAPAPDWLVDWCKSNAGSQTVTTGHAEFDDTTPIAEGSRNSALASILGRARQVLGMDRDELEQFGLSINSKRCQPPLSDSEVRTIAASISRYAVSTPAPIILGGKPVGQISVPTPIVPGPEPEKIAPVPYPVFPSWVMKGTSLYDGFVGPVCDKNSRFPEYSFMSGIVTILNYVGTKVRIEYKKIVPSFYMVMIGRRGRVFKSSSFRDAIEYLSHAGIVADGGPQVRNAEGKSMVFTAGSPEGLGIEMSRTNCKNSILYYDELSLLTSKAGIDGSSMMPQLLSIHEGNKFANLKAIKKENFSFEPGSFCVSLIACVTDKAFNKEWSKLPGNKDSGMLDRFFFLYQPEILPPATLYHEVDTREAAVETRKRIDKAIKQQVYSIEDSTRLEHEIDKLGVRVESRAEKLALYFAIDLGKDTIDDACIERAIAICRYEIAAKKYLKVFQSTTKEGSIQNQIIHTLQRNQGVMDRRDLERIIHPLDFGTSLFGQCYYGLMKAGYITECGTGVKNDPIKTILMRVDKDEEDE